MLSKLFPLFYATLALAILTACTTVSPQRDGLLEQTVEGTQLTSQQLRLYLNEYAIRFDRQVEEAADQILSQTTDPEVARNALMWKIHVISANYRATARPDAFAAFIDVWILSKQMSRFFDGGAGSELFGQFQSIAVDTSRELEQTIRQIALKIAPSEEVIQEGEKKINDAVQSDPLQNLYLVRQSTVLDFIDRYQPADLGVMEVVGNVSDDLAALQQILIVYGDYLPRQARWQAEMMLMDMRRAEPVAHTLDDISVIADSLDRIASLTDSLSELAERERKVLLKAVHHERVESFNSIEQMREATLQYVSDERDAIFLSIEQERLAIMEQINAERELVIREIENMSQDLMLESRELIDHFYMRAFQLVSFIIVMAIILVIAYKRFIPSRNISNTSVV